LMGLVSAIYFAFVKTQLNVKDVKLIEKKDEVQFWGF